jgi:cytochrome c
MRSRFFWQVPCGLLLSLIVSATASFGEQKPRGNELFQNRCGGCHATDHDRVGPRLRGVVGRAAGAVRTFEYSDALKASHIVWDAQTLDKWLQDPEAVVPDSDMAFRLEDRAERTAIVEYLKTLTTN